MITKISVQKEINKIKKDYKELNAYNYFNGTRYEHDLVMGQHRTNLIHSDIGHELFYSLTSLKIKTVIDHFEFKKHSFGIDTYRRYKHYTVLSNDVRYSISHNKDRGVDIFICQEDIDKHENPEEVYYNFFKELMQIQNPDLDINKYYPDYSELKKRVLNENL